jgi:hypothetical protein
MKLPVQDHINKRGDALSNNGDPLSTDNVPLDEVLFEIGVILAMNLAAALLVVRALRTAGLFPD